MKNLLPYLIIAGLLVLLFFSMRGCVKREVQEHTIIQAAKSLPDSGKIWRDERDREHRRAEAAVSDRQTIELAYGDLLDSVATLNDVRSKDIEQITWLNTELSGRHEAAVTNTVAADGHTAVNFQYSDKYLRLFGTGDVTADSLSDLWLDYQLRDSLIVTTMRKRTGLFRKGTFVDVTSANPEVHVTGVRSIIVRDKSKPWGIGLQAGATYTFPGWRPYVGLGFSYNIIRF